MLELPLEVGGLSRAGAGWPGVGWGGAKQAFQGFGIQGQGRQEEVFKVCGATYTQADAQ